MLHSKKMIGVLAASTIVLSAVPAVPALAESAGTPSEPTREAAQTTTAQAALAEVHHVLLDNVQGVLTWDQGVPGGNKLLRQALYQAPEYLCGATALEQYQGSADAITTITVKGSVENSFMADVSEYEQKAPMRKVMGCTCSGNPVDGRASMNAEVEGFQLGALIADARPMPGTNAMTFTSADGYKVTLPYTYVKQRYSVIVSQINGEPAKEAVGCANQLWLGNTSARAFARDVVEIEFSVLEQEPAVPTAAEAMNQPNVGVLEG